MIRNDHSNMFSNKNTIPYFVILADIPGIKHIILINSKQPFRIDQSKTTTNLFFLPWCCIWLFFCLLLVKILLLLHHIGMPIPYLKKSWIKNPKLITQVVRTIQHSAFGVVLDWLVQLSWIVLDFAIQDFLRYGIAPILSLVKGFSNSFHRDKKLELENSFTSERIAQSFH